MIRSNAKAARDRCWHGEFTEAAEHEPDSRRVLELVKASDCSAYDCEFVALDESLGVTVVTMDAKLIKAFPKIAERLIAG